MGEKIEHLQVALAQTRVRRHLRKSKYGIEDVETHERTTLGLPGVPRPTSARVQSASSNPPHLERSHAADDPSPRYRGTTAGGNTYVPKRGGSKGSLGDLADLGFEVSGGSATRTDRDQNVAVVVRGGKYQVDHTRFGGILRGADKHDRKFFEDADEMKTYLKGIFKNSKGPSKPMKPRKRPEREPPMS